VGDKIYKPKKTPSLSEDESSDPTDESDIQVVSALAKNKKPKKKKAKVSLENALWNVNM
jgi:hypothetical protein